MAIHPELVDKLLNFQNSILGNDDGCLDDNQGSNSNEDANDNEDGGRKSNKQIDLAVELKVNDDKEHVNMNITKIPLVSYPPTTSKSSHLSGMPAIMYYVLKRLKRLNIKGLCSGLVF